MVRVIKFTLVAGFMLVLAGCQVVTSSLKTTDAQAFKLTGTTVKFDPQAAIWWGDGERAYAASKGADASEAETLAKTSAGTAYIRGQIASKVKSAMDRNLGAKLTGTRPVRVEVMVKNFTIASAAQRIIVGGSHMLQASVKLIDVHSGAVLVEHPGMVSMSGAGQGITGVIVESAIVSGEAADRVTNEFANNYKNWLLPS